jgi:hypothetical protein
MSSAFELPEVNPGVSTKQMFLSKMVSELLFRLRVRDSSTSVHQCGYDLVLAWVSVIRVVLELSVFVLRDFAFGGIEWESEFEGENASTWTMSSHNWSIARIRDVFPQPDRLLDMMLLIRSL